MGIVLRLSKYKRQNGIKKKVLDPKNFEPNLNSFYIEKKESKGDPQELLSLLHTYVKQKQGNSTWNKKTCEVTGELMMTTGERLVIKANAYVYKEKEIIVFKRHQGSHPSYAAFFDQVFCVVSEHIGNFVQDDDDEEEEKEKSETKEKKKSTEKKDDK